MSHLPRDSAAARAYIKESPSIDFNDPLVQNIAREILSGSGATTDLEKLRAINRYIQSHFSYSVSAVGKVRKASEALRRETNICHGYALSMIALCNAMDIPAAYVQARNSPAPTNITLRRVFTTDLRDSALHATVFAFVDGQWLEVDPTGNLIEQSTRQIAKYNLYLLVTPPGQFHERISSPTIVDISRSSTKISIDGQSVSEFPAFISGATTYLPVKALAAALEAHGQAKHFDTTLTDIYRYDIGIIRDSHGIYRRHPNSVTAVITPGVSYHADTSTISDYHTTQFYGRRIGMPIYIGGIARDLTALQGLTSLSDTDSPSSVQEYFIEIHSLLSALDISVTYDPSTDTYLLDTAHPY